MRGIAYRRSLALMFAILGVLNGTIHGFSYRPPSEINTAIKSIAKGMDEMAVVHLLGVSPGGTEVNLLALGNKNGSLPAILVVANLEGNCPQATEVAMALAAHLTGEWRDDLAKHSWYIVPMGNPDGYANYFARPQAKRSTNSRPFNDDNDDAIDEDGPEDLNGDGLITSMRQLHPEGSWLGVEDNPVLLKKPEKGKGEAGIFQLYEEGLDNDGDGEFNEDPLGGVNPGNNFPHNFQHYTNTGGPWSASEAESRGLMRFALDHPEIAMVIVFGRTNSLKTVPESSKKSEASQDSYQLPSYIARDMGVDPEQRFSMEELIEMGKEFSGFPDLTEEMVLQFLGVGAAVNPDKKDLPYWNEISKRYNDFMKEIGLDGERIAPPEFPYGSFEEWGYYQYGVPTFSLDFWSPPIKKKEESKKEGAISPDDIEKMSNDEFVALGKEKIEAFLKASNAPAQYSADMVINAVQGGMFSTKQIAKFMRQSQKKEESGGADPNELALYEFSREAFAPWTPYDHPTLGKVEIGGMIPYVNIVPPPALAESLIIKQIPFVRELAKLLPKVAIDTVAVEREAVDVWRLNIWVSDTGYLPFPTFQGQRCQRPTPAVVLVKGDGITLLEGREREAIGVLDGSGGAKKISRLVRGSEGSSVRIALEASPAGKDERTVTLKGGAR